MKYFIVRIGIDGKKQYRKNKTVDGAWSPEFAKGYCWRFSKQGAKKIIERYGYHPLYKYELEPVNQEEIDCIELLNILGSYKRMIARNKKDYPTVLIDDLEKSIEHVINKYTPYYATK